MKICPTCKQDATNAPVEVSEMTNEEFIRRQLDVGYIHFTIFGYTIDEIEKILDKYNLPKK